MRNLLLFAILFLSAACYHAAKEDSDEAVLCNERSYHERYINIDSALYYAERAESLSKHNCDSWVESQINKAFVQYQQMNFDEALKLLSSVEQISRNQFHRLEAHILYMKIAQRVGDGESFFTHRNRALHILNRIQEGYESISEHYSQLVNYASSELHIVASTYYYYLGLDSMAVNEISMAYDFVKEGRDTAQWLNYNYMLGSGGLIVDKPDKVILREFEHLFLTYTMAKAKHYIYFEANALQSLASMLSDSVAVSLIKQEQVGSYSFLQAQYSDDESSDSLSFALCLRAIELFEQNKDSYQTACAYRTLGELYFSNAEYVNALDAFQYALSIVEEQSNKSGWTINPWMAGIREKLSMTYSALGDKYQSDLNRNIYLDLLDQYRQNYESETRLQELKREIKSVRIRTAILFVVILLTALLAFILMRRMKSHSRNQIARLTSFSETEQFQELAATAEEVCQGIDSETELVTDELNLSRLHIENYKTENAERRAKVSMVYSIIPYLDRMMAEVRKMIATDSIEPERLHYVGELADEIMRINEILTDWIKMSQGRLNLHITTFPIQDIIDVIALSKLTFEQKNIHLTLPETIVQVKADKALTLFMVNTLADNARKYTPDGGEVSIEVDAAEDYVEVSVTDTGVGLSEEDCQILNDNKVYDASAIGKSDQPKGFGFGIMNCKGIINKYRKTSPLFNVCQFGVSSQLDQGSRFWFRLPRVLSLLLVLLSFLSPSYGQRSDDYVTIYDSLYSANIAGHHDAVTQFGREFIDNLAAPFDTAYVVLIENEIAVAALATQDWDLYRRSNADCVRLHKLFTQDKSIVAYCDRMQQLHDNGILLYLMLILLIETLGTH